MQLEREFLVPVPVDQAWHVLLDLERIAPCVPGATLEGVEGESFTGRVQVKVGPIRVTYAGTATFLERDDAARRVVIDVRGKEPRGSSTAAATVRAQLFEEGGATRVAVVTDLQVTGKPAQFRRGLMAEANREMLSRFADCLAEELGADAATAGGCAVPAASDTATGLATGTASVPAPLTGADQAATATTAEEAAAAAAAGVPGVAAGPAGAPGTDAAPAGAPGTTAPGDAWAGATDPIGRDAPPRPRSAPRESEEAIDLLEAARGPLLRRGIPAGLCLLAALLVVGRWVARRRR